VASLYFTSELPVYDEAAGLRWTQRFAMRDPRAMITYASFVHDGRYGLRADPVKAKALFEEALTKFPDEPYVLNALGVLTLKGLNAFTPDPARGIELLKKAYEQGSSISARSLQKIYTKGMGVPADGAEASKWEQLAVAAGAPEIPMD
jgi:TPR repeat protein